VQIKGYPFAFRSTSFLSSQQIPRTTPRAEKSLLLSKTASAPKFALTTPLPSKKVWPSLIRKPGRAATPLSKSKFRTICANSSKK